MHGAGPSWTTRKEWDRPTLDDELRLGATLGQAARERGRPLPSIDAADALLDERRELTKLGYNPPREFAQFPM